jgi:hypothetical protein
MLKWLRSTGLTMLNLRLAECDWSLFVCALEMGFVIARHSQQNETKSKAFDT